jgi:hypothetical protein
LGRENKRQKEAKEAPPTSAHVCSAVAAAAAERKRHQKRARVRTTRNSQTVLR